MSNIHNIPTINSVDRGHFQGANAEGSCDTVTVAVNGKRFGVGGWTAEGKGRLIFKGPLVPGPQAYLFGKCSVIDNHGGTGAIEARLREAGLRFDVNIGDTLVIEGSRFLVEGTPTYPTLTLTD